MQAIITKYLSATDRRGSRIKAKCDRGSVTIPYPHELSEKAAHEAAAQALGEWYAEEDRKAYGPDVVKPGQGWLAPRVCGALPNGDYAHVFIA